MRKADPSPPPGSQRLRAEEEEHRQRLFVLAGEMEEPLAQARALADALDLMGLGLRHVSDDHGAALLAIAEVLSRELKTAQTLWRKVLAACAANPCRYQAENPLITLFRFPRPDL